MRSGPGCQSCLPFMRSEWPSLVVPQSCCGLRLSVGRLWNLTCKLCDGLKGGGFRLSLFPFNFVVILWTFGM